VSCLSQIKDIKPDSNLHGIGFAFMAFVIAFTLAAIGYVYAQSGRWKLVLALFNNDAVGFGDTRELKGATTYLYVSLAILLLTLLALAWRLFWL
jgi:FtsH-binding integral membrane protein